MLSVRSSISAQLFHHLPGGWRSILWCGGLLACVLALAACESPGPPEPADEGETHVRIGYVLGSRGVDVSAREARQLTHINYAFANVTKDGRVVLEHERDAANLAQLRALKDANPGLKILLAIGGWAWSDYFSDAALTDSSRARFARTAVQLLDEHNLDGLDIDWEYPGQPGQDNIYRPEDRENFTRLLQAVRRHLDEQGEQDGRTGENRYLLTIAAGASERFVQHTNMAAAQAPLDFVNLMTYDFHGAWTPHTGHHANLYAPAAPDTIQRSVSAAVDLFIDAGVPPEKLVLGVPFYGRGWTGVRQQNNGLYQPYDAATGGIPYDSLAAHYVNQRGFTRHWDDGAQAPFLWNADSATVISYEDPESLRAKAQFIRSRGLGGAMYWEHNADDDTLLNTLYEALK